MISYQVYKLIHFLGIFMLLASLGGILLHRINGGAPKHPWRRQAMIAHGLGLFLVLLGGFGMLARLGIAAAMPGWVYAKVAIWLLLGLFVVIGARFRPSVAKGLWWAAIALGSVAAYLAINKPF